MSESLAPPPAGTNHLAIALIVVCILLLPGLVLYGWMLAVMIGLLLGLPLAAGDGVYGIMIFLLGGLLPWLGSLVGYHLACAAIKRANLTCQPASPRWLHWAARALPTLPWALIALLALWSVAESAWTRKRAEDATAMVEVVLVDQLEPDHETTHFSLHLPDGPGHVATNIDWQRQYCCFALPARWQSGMAFNIAWRTRDRTSRESQRHEATIPLPAYTTPHRLTFHIAPDGVRAEVTSASGAPDSKLD
ncbi:MAG: DUF3304 domain-containing protein [Pseudomonas sp.]